MPEQIFLIQIIIIKIALVRQCIQDLKKNEQNFVIDKFYEKYK